MRFCDRIYPDFIALKFIYWIYIFPRIIVTIDDWKTKQDIESLKDSRHFFWGILILGEARQSWEELQVSCASVLLAASRVWARSLDDGGIELSDPSHEQWKNPGCLEYIGDYTTQLCGECTLPETNILLMEEILPPENWCLEDDPYLSGSHLFRCELLVSGRVTIWYWHIICQHHVFESCYDM